jgi:hypothetical protein
MFAFVFFIFFRLSFPVVLFRNLDINLHISYHHLHAFSFKNPTFTLNPIKWIGSYHLKGGDTGTYDSQANRYCGPFFASAEGSRMNGQVSGRWSSWGGELGAYINV